MIGLLVIVGAAAWIMFCRWAAKGATQYVRRWKLPARWLVFALLLPLPLVDELVAMFQVMPLCRAGKDLRVEPARIKGRTVRIDTSDNAPLAGTAVPVIAIRFTYRDALTGEELAYAHRYSAHAGFLVRTVGGEVSLPPLLPVTGEGSTCNGPSMREMARKYSFILLTDKGGSR